MYRNCVASIVFFLNLSFLQVKGFLGTFSAALIIVAKVTKEDRPDRHWAGRPSLTYRKRKSLLHYSFFSLQATLADLKKVFY